jgi:hypothetical protein
MPTAQPAARALNMVNQSGRLQPVPPGQGGARSLAARPQRGRLGLARSRPVTLDGAAVAPDPPFCTGAVSRYGPLEARRTRHSGTAGQMRVRRTRQSYEPVTRVSRNDGRAGHHGRRSAETASTVYVLAGLPVKEFALLEAGLVRIQSASGTPRSVYMFRACCQCCRAWCCWPVVWQAPARPWWARACW